MLIELETLLISRQVLKILGRIQKNTEISFETLGTEFRVDLAGGKGGFGSSVDKVAQASTNEGRYLSAVDFLTGL